MAGKWRRWAIEFFGWLVGPNLVVGLLTGLGGLIWASVADLPAVVIALISLAALTLGVALTHYALALLGRHGFRRPSPALKGEVTTIQRELIRLDNRRQMNGGSMWPVERPYRDLPSEQWNATRGTLRLRRDDRRATEDAYALLSQFNDEMLRGETIIASSAAQEPDLDGLRNAFDHAAEVLGLPAMNDGGSRETEGVRFDSPFSVTMSPFLFHRLQRGDEPWERDPWALLTLLRVVNHSSSARVNIDLELRVPSEWSEVDRIIEPMTTREAGLLRFPPKIEIDFPLTLEPEEAVKGTVPFEFQPLKVGEEDVIEEGQIRLIATDHISQCTIEIAPEPHLPGKINHY